MEIWKEDEPILIQRAYIAKNKNFCILLEVSLLIKFE